MAVVLGVDIGTTSVKTVLVNYESGAIIASQSEETKAYTKSGALHTAAAEQAVSFIFRAIDRAIKRLPRDTVSHVKAIGVCGQMHGCMLWKRNCIDLLLEKLTTFDRMVDCLTDDNVSHLITWEDGRCNTEFLRSLPPSQSGRRIAKGYGCSTLFWMQKHQSDVTKKYDCSATIQDFLVSILCKLTVPIMSYHNAHSWGYFSQAECTWEEDILRDCEFPVHLLPAVVPPGSVAGMTVNRWYGISPGVPVLAALGDMQCSVQAAMETVTDAVLNIGTSAQLSYQLALPIPTRCVETVEYQPFMMNRSLVVAASLNGGNVLMKFVSLLQNWVSELGLECPTVDTIYSRLLEGGEMLSTLKISPLLYGERHCPSVLGSVANISPHSPSLGETFTALCDGLIANIAGMLSNETLRNAGILRVIGTGSALVKNPILQAAVKRHFDFPLVIRSSSDAAIGAAQYAIETLRSSKHSKK